MQEADSTLPERTYTIAEVAELLRFDEQTIRRRIRAGAIQAVDLAAPGAEQPVYRIKAEELRRLLAG